jgi:hypothetical protein
MEKLKRDPLLGDLTLQISRSAPWALGSEITNIVNSWQTWDLDLIQETSKSIRGQLLNIAKQIQMLDRLTNWKKLQYVRIVVEYHEVLTIHAKTCRKKIPTFQSIWDSFTKV